MGTRKAILALLALILVISAMAVPVVSKSNFSGNQQYGYCDNCHSAQSTITVTMESSPSAATTIAPGATVSVWVNASGSMSGATQVGALISSTTGTSSSLPSNGGWTITSDPSGSATTYNYYKFTPYSSSHSFKWVLTAPQTTGTHSLYGRILHSGSQEYYKNVGSLNFNVQAAVAAPTVAITSPTNGATVSATIIVAATVTPGAGATITQAAMSVDGVQKLIDTTAPYSFSLDTSTLTNAVHTISVTATDNGARTGSQSISVTVNNVVVANPLVTVSSPASGATISGTTTITGTVVLGVGATLSQVVLTVDGAQKATGATTSFSFNLDTTTLTNAGHTITVTATDNGARTGSKSISVTVLNQAVLPPTVVISQPSNGATVTGTITVSATVTPGVGASISSVTLTVDGGAGIAMSGNPYTVQVNTASWSTGQHTLVVTAIDNGARTGTQSIVVYKGAPAVPVVDITAPTNGAVVYGTVVVQSTVTSTYPITSVDLKIDGVSQGAKTSAPYTWSVNTLILSNAQHTVLVTATDDIAQTGSMQIAVTVSNTPPIVDLLTPISGTTVQGSLRVEAHVTSLAPVSYVNLRVDGVQQFNNTTSAPYVWFVDTLSLSNGQHTLRATAGSSTGLSGFMQVTVTVANIAPLVTFLSPINHATIQGMQTVEVSVSSSAPIVYASLRVDGSQVANITSAPYQWDLNTTYFADGAHALNVTVGSNIGQRGYAEISVTLNNLASVAITSPTNGGAYDGTINLAMTFNAPGGPGYILIKVGGNQVANLSSAPYQTSLNTASYPDGSLVINVTAVDAHGNRLYQEITISIDNAGQEEPLLEMAATGIAGVLGIIALILTLTTAVMFYRNKKGGGA
jgi:hypothetical protein